MNKLLRKQLNICVCIILILISVLMTALPVNAASSKKKEEEKPVANGAYEVMKYDFEADVDKTHSYAVTEKITVNLMDNMKSLSFPIPNGNYRVFDLKVDKTDYYPNNRGAETLVTILDESKLTKGKHTYTIQYVIREFADRDAEKDMFYFSVLLPGWSQPITDLSIKANFPEDFPWDDMQYYAGQYGVQNFDTKLNYVADKKTKTVSITGSRIPANFGITLKAQLPQNYWRGALDGVWAIYAMLAIMAATVVLLLIFWLIGGRDPKHPRKKQVHPVEGVSPAEVGYIFNNKVRVRDIISLIVYFGTKGYLKISEYEPKKYRIIRDEYPKDEEKYVRTAYDILFEDVPDGRWLEMEDLGSKLRAIKYSIREDIAAGFSSKDMSAYTSLSKVLRIVGIILLSIGLGAVSALQYSYEYMSINYFEALAIAGVSAALLVVLCTIFDRQFFSEEKTFTLKVIVAIIAYAVVPIVVAIRLIMLTKQIIPAIIVVILAFVGAFLVVIMRARGKGNTALASRFMQLRHFIYHPEASDIAENYFADQNYYYEIVPYALIFHGLETWAISFLTLNVPKPEWYSVDIEGNAFLNLRGEANVLDYAKDIKDFARTLENSYHSMKKNDKK